MPTWIGFIDKEKKRMPLINSTSGQFSKKRVKTLTRKKSRRVI